ncbi:MAG: hypothetical protein FJ304_10920 [Planctomycetes bacterium]|nr:hypothetical protein [Planctomycetota bacterium]
MSAAASPPSCPFRPRAGLALFALALALIGGCGKPPPPVDPAGDSVTTKVDPWKTTGPRLKKSTELAECKSALAALSADTGAETGRKLTPITPEVLAALAALVPLSADDSAEVGAPVFTSHDAGYLSDCFYLRDAARALGVAGLPPEQQADRAFAWVCRQVYLYPWLRQLPNGALEPTALPPVAVLRRGYGSGLERMYVFLALAQQLDLDVCLIGGPDAGKVEARGGPVITYTYADTVARAPRGPFWAVGARVGTDVRLYDPWRGTALPVTLNQLRTNPGAATAWFEDKANVSGATPDDAKKATAFLAVPVNALTPRMTMFEAHLKGDLGLRVAIDAKALQARFPDPKPAFWLTAGDYDYGRAARSFFPAEMGGGERNTQRGKLYDIYVLQQIPQAAFQLPAGLDRPDARDRLQGLAAGTLAAAYIEPPNPRERVQRGQFQEAARDVVAKQERFADGLERLRVNKDVPRQIDEWVAGANDVYLQLTRAIEIEKTAPAIEMAQQAINEHWKAPGALYIIDRASAEVGRAEAAYLLALCNHEQAEGAQVRADRATPADADRLRAEAATAWENARAAWRSYEQYVGAHAGFPGRAAHGKALAARAAAHAKK